MPRPVVLVPGYLCPRVGLRLLRDRLRERGLRVYIARIGPLALEDVRTLARRLDGEVRRILAKEGADRADLVAVSQGGLAAAWWLLHLGGSDLTERFVAVATPFRGTWFAVAGLPAFGFWTRGVWQVLPRSEIVRGLREKLVPEALRVTSIALDGDPVAPPATCELPGARFLVLNGPRRPWTHQSLVLRSDVAEAVYEALSS
jgi:triacylglycerol esterase/lipase EstA (alpha/beta hydrolase family)